MTIKEWFEQYINLPIADLKKTREEILNSKEVEVSHNQITGLDLAIITIERDPDYSHMFTKDKKNKEKGRYVSGRGYKK